MVVVEKVPKLMVGGRSSWYSNGILSLLNFKVKYETAWPLSFLPLLNFRVRYETLRPQRLNKTGMVISPVTERNIHPPFRVKQKSGEYYRI